MQFPRGGEHTPSEALGQKFKMYQSVEIGNYEIRDLKS